MTDIDYVRYLRRTAIVLKFSFPANFKRYNSSRLVRCYNGIGAEWMPQKLRDFMTDMFFSLQAAALIHDFEYTHKKKSYWRFTVANVRFAYNACRSRRPFSGIAGALICQIIGWKPYLNGKEKTSNGTSS